MSKFVGNPVQFAADCMCEEGQCRIARENVLFLDGGNDLAAVDYLQRRCGHVVITPDGSHAGQALLYHTSCDRMTDVVNQLFEGHLLSPESLPQASAEMSVGALYRRGVTMPFEDCRARVDGFPF